MPLFRHAVGKQIYVWTSSPTGKSRNAAMITAHGLSTCMSGMNQAPADVRLHYYCPHGYILSDPGLDAILNGAIPIVETLPARRSHDYILAKYQNSATNRHNNVREDYEMILKSPERLASQFADVKGRVESPARGTTPSTIKRERKQLEKLEQTGTSIPMDIITIRNRGFMSPPRLSWVLNVLALNGFAYSEVHCNFCRSFLSDGILGAIPGFERAFGQRPMHHPDFSNW